MEIGTMMRALRVRCKSPRFIQRRLICVTWIIGTCSIAQADEMSFTQPLETYRSYIERPLFSPQRKAAEDGPEIVESPQLNQVPPLNAILLGLISSEDGTGLALLRVEGEPNPVRVHVGESILGWQLEKLGDHQALFTFGEEKAVLEFPKATTDAPATTSDPAVDSTGNVPLMPDVMINP